jgi:hypothetical protein
MDTDALRLFVRQKLQDGRLPYNHIPRVWGGPGAFETCDACESPVTEHQMVMEGIALGGGRKPLQMHVRCFAIWDEERRDT